MATIQQQIEAHIPGLRRYARALVRDVVGADDLVQECLARALVKLHLWREGTDLRAWLFTILHNQYVNQVRRSIREGVTLELGEVTPLLLSQSAAQDRGLELRDLDRALGRLPEEQRAVILLVGLEGMTYVDAAAILGIPAGTVRSRLSRGREALRDLMGIAPRRSVRQETRARTPRREAHQLSTTTPWPIPSVIDSHTNA
jgi:RNA polymerase sigma-70 factor (ECF subfamily)